MDCLSCGSKTVVVDVSNDRRQMFGEASVAVDFASKNGLNPVIVRMRKCVDCGHRFSTIECVLEDLQDFIEGEKENV